jgi:hypothetical protein
LLSLIIAISLFRRRLSFRFSSFSLDDTLMIFCHAIAAISYAMIIFTLFTIADITLSFSFRHYRYAFISFSFADAIIFFAFILFSLLRLLLMPYIIYAFYEAPDAAAEALLPAGLPCWIFAGADIKAEAMRYTAAPFSSAARFCA